MVSLWNINQINRPTLFLKRRIKLPFLQNRSWTYRLNPERCANLVEIKPRRLLEPHLKPFAIWLNAIDAIVLSTKLGIENHSMQHIALIRAVGRCRGRKHFWHSDQGGLNVIATATKSNNTDASRINNASPS